MDYLKFSVGNAKINQFIAIFDIVAGVCCPFAKDCLSKADRFTGKITDGKDTKFRCFSASTECLRTRVRALRWYNYLLLKNVDNIQELIQNSIDNTAVKNASKFRIHTSGDFFSQEYFNAWLEIAKNSPKIVFMLIQNLYHFGLKK